MILLNLKWVIKLTIPRNFEEESDHSQIVNWPTDKLALVEGGWRFPDDIAQVDSPEQEEYFN